MENNSSKVLTIKDVSEKLGIGTQSVRILMKKPDFPSFKLGAKICVSEKDFNEWLENLAGKEITLNSKNSKKGIN